MILISQGAWIQTGILPLQPLLNIWCSSPFPACRSQSLSAHLPPSATPQNVSHLPRWEIFCKGLPSLSTSSAETSLKYIYCTVQVPACTWVWMDARVWSYRCTVLCVFPARKGSDLLILVFRTYCEIKSLKFRREPPPGSLWRMFRYTNVSAQETPFRWRVNMSCLCLYNNNCAAVRGRRCMIPAERGLSTAVLPCIISMLI